MVLLHQESLTWDLNPCWKGWGVQGCVAYLIDKCAHKVDETHLKLWKLSSFPPVHHGLWEDTSLPYCMRHLIETDNFLPKSAFLCQPGSYAMSSVKAVYHSSLPPPQSSQQLFQTGLSVYVLGGGRNVFPLCLSTIYLRKGLCYIVLKTLGSFNAKFSICYYSKKNIC